MARKFVVDAHALVWHLEGNPRLGAAASAILRDLSSSLLLPAVALAEACWTVEVGRTSIASVADLLNEVDGDARVTVVPLDRWIVGRAATMTAVPEMHDRQIVATALQVIDRGDAAVILTRDVSIRNSGLVPTVW